jgi:hypothetical protein
MRPSHLLATLAAAIALVTALWLYLGTGALEVHAELAGGASAARAADASHPVPSAGDARADGERSTAAVASDATVAELPADTAPSKPEATGRVVGPDGRGLAGARVWAARATAWSAPIPLDVEREAYPRGWARIHATVTAEDGTYRLEDVGKGALRIVARAHGFAPRYESRWSLEGKPGERLPDLVLGPGVVLAGRVVDRAGEGVEGAAILAAVDRLPGVQNVSMPGRGVPLATSGPGGTFVVDELAAGPHRLIVDAPGFLVHEHEGRVDAPGGRQEGLVLVLESGLEIHGRVRSAAPLPEGVRLVARRVSDAKGEDGEAESGAGPAASARDVRSRSALADAEGAFVVRGLEPLADYRITATVPGAEPDTWKRVTSVDAVTARAGQRGVELTWKPEATLVFQVVDAATRAPLEDLDVWAGVGRLRAVRDEKGEPQRAFPEGRVRVPELRPQAGRAVQLRVRAAGYEEHDAKDLVLAEGQTLDLGTLALERERALTVRVTAGGGPVRGARVVATLGDADELGGWLDGEAEDTARGNLQVWSARTDPSGVARLTGAPGKALTIGAAAAGYLASEPMRALHPPDADHHVELELRRGGTVVVRVVDPRGKPLSGVGVAHRPPGETEAEEGWTALSAEKTSDAAGVARFAPLAPGVHGFCLHDETGEVWLDAGDATTQRPQWIERTIVEGSELEIGLVAAPRGSLAGRIREGGQPLEGAQVRLQRVREGEGGDVESWGGPQDPSLATTDHEGRYAYESFRCGEYWLSVHHATRRMGARFRVTVAEEPRRFDVELDAAAIEGTVTDVEGQPLAGVEVSVQATSGEHSDEAPYQIVVREDDRGNAQMDYRQGSRSTERTDARGRYVLRGLAADRPLVVRIESDLVEQAQSPEITLAADEVRTGVDFRLRRAGRIEVTLGGGLPKQDAWYEVLAYQRVGEREELRGSTWIGGWNRHGVLRGLPPGTYRVVLSPPGRAEPASDRPWPSKELEVRPQETGHVVLDAF